MSGDPGRSPKPHRGCVRVKALLIVLTGLLVLVNAFFVVAEYALVRSRRARLEAMAEEGSRGARIALGQLDDIGDYISACQVGITMASIGIGALGEPAIAHALEPIFGTSAATTWPSRLSVVIAYVLITFFQSTVGEIVPKLYTIQHAEGLARRIAPVDADLHRSSSGRSSSRSTSPRSGCCGASASTPTPSPSTARPRSSSGSSPTPRPAASIDAGEAEMLTGVFHLHEQEARQVMTPIPAVVTVDIAATVGEALRQAVATGHSRLVVIEDDDQDQVRGIVHVNQLVKLLMDSGEEASFASRRARGADRPGDQAARRPARRPAARAHRDGDRDRRVRPHRRDRHDRGHHRGDRRRDLR